MTSKGLVRGILAVVVLVAAGCTQTGLTKPTRSATEQLLISTAADRALAQCDFSIVRGKNVYLETTNFSSYDKEYVIGSIRDFVESNEGRLTSFDHADIVIEPRSGALSIDSSDSLIGLPSSGAPLPLAGAVQIPEIALYKSEKQFSIAKIAILAYERDSKKHVASSGPLIGRANIKYFKILGIITYNKTNLPERKKQPKEKTRIENGQPLKQ